MSPLRPQPEPRMDAGVADGQCRGEDSNLCSIGERDLHVGHPLRHGLELAVALAGCMCVIAVFAGYHVALAGLTALPLLANARTRPVRVSSPAIAVGEARERRDRSDA